MTSIVQIVLKIYVIIRDTITNWLEIEKGNGHVTSTNLIG